MRDHEKPYHSYPLRHRFISWVNDINVRGFRRLADKLPDWLLPDPKQQGEIMLNTLHGIHLHINPSLDNGVELSLFRTGSYEAGILDFIQKKYNPNGTFVDVGANIGLMSLMVGKQFNTGFVHAFEAHPRTAEILERNRIANTVSNIEIHQLALGNETGEVTIYDNWDVNRGGASLVIKSEGSQAYQTPMKRMDDMDVGAPSMIKIDVEGVELEVLKGAAQTIRLHQPILIVEVSDNRANKHGSSVEIVDFIKSLGDYTIYKLKGGKERRSSLIEITSNDQLPAHDNIVCISK